MKKAKCFACCLFACSCCPHAAARARVEERVSRPPCLPEFEADMTAVISEQTIKAHIVRHALLSCEIRVTEPKMFNGVRSFGMATPIVLNINRWRSMLICHNFRNPL